MVVIFQQKSTDEESKNDNNCSLGDLNKKNTPKHKGQVLQYKQPSILNSYIQTYINKSLSQQTHPKRLDTLLSQIREEYRIQSSRRVDTSEKRCRYDIKGGDDQLGTGYRKSQ